MEDSLCSNPLLLTRAAQWMLHKIKEFKAPLISAFVVGMMCYVYAFTNKLVNHDEVYNLFEKGATVTSGRWGLGALDIVLPNYSLPWVNGILTLFFITIACCIIINILSIQNKTLQALLSGCIIAFPSLIGTMAYMFTSSAFGLSFLLAVLAVWFVCKHKRSFLILALGCMVASLSIYQSYISISASLLVIVLIRELLQEENILTILRRGILYVCFLIAALALYYAATEVALYLKDEVLNSYASANISFSLASISTAIVTAYQTFFRFISEGYHGLIPTIFSKLLHLILMSVTVILLLLRLTYLGKSDFFRILLLFTLILLIPLAVCCMYLFTTPESVHTLVLYGFICVYAFITVVADLCIGDDYKPRIQQLVKTLSVNILSLALFSIILCNIFLANEIWLNLQLRYENAYAFYSSVLSDLRTCPEFTEDMPIAVIGRPRDPEFYAEEFPFCEVLTGTKGFKPDSYSREKFFTYYLGIELPFLPDYRCEEMATNPEIVQMPCYPYYGSVQVVDNTIVVKLS